MAKRPAATKQSEEDILKAAMERVAQQSGDEADDVEAAPAGNKKKKAAAAAPASAPAATPTKADKGEHTVTYRALEEGDPVFTMFYGLKFEMNLPRKTSNPELVALARTNPWFSVDGKPPPKRIKAPKREDDGQSAQSGMGLPENFDPDKHEVEVADVAD